MDVRHRARAARSALPSGRRGLGGHSNRTLPAARVGAETVDVGEERMSVAAMRYVLRQQSTAGSGVRAGGRCGASRGRNGGVHVSRDPQNTQIVPRSSVRLRGGVHQPRPPSSSGRRRAQRLRAVSRTGLPGSEPPLNAMASITAGQPSNSAGTSARARRRTPRRRIEMTRPQQACYLHAGWHRSV